MADLRSTRPRGYASNADLPVERVNGGTVERAILANLSRR